MRSILFVFFGYVLGSDIPKMPNVFPPSDSEFDVDTFELEENEVDEIDAKELQIEMDDAKRETSRPLDSISAPEIVDVENFPFQAETSRLMDIIVHSLYSNREIFLRELVSNASDALEKVRFENVKKQNQKEETLEIYIEADGNTISVTDTGVGMTREELINNLGTIAKSGTKAFTDMLETSGDLSLVGQFGVGFYSSFLVADKVVVTSKADSEKDQHVWSSDATGTFSISKDPRGPTLGRGTRITLYLRDNAKEFLKPSNLRALVRRHSGFVKFPVFVKNEDKWEHANAVVPIWMRSKDEISQSDYTKFYRILTNDYANPPLTYSHFAGEGDISFKALLYFPHNHSTAFLNGGSPAKFKIYSKRVLLDEKPKDILPNYLSFVSGVVDSDDFPMKIDRENVSDTRVMKTIKNKLLRKVFSMLKQMGKDHDAQVVKDEEDGKVTETAQEIFTKNMGTLLSNGCTQDHKNRSTIASLLRFKSTKSDRLTNLDAVVSRMIEKQEQLYYLKMKGESKSHPLLKKYESLGVEVILTADSGMVTCFDELSSYKTHKLINVENINAVKLPADESEEHRAKGARRHLAEFTSFIQKLLKEHYKDSPSVVTINFDHLDSPAMVSSKMTIDRYYIIKAQPWYKEGQFDYMFKKTFTINPDHKIVNAVFKDFTSNGESEKLKKVIRLMYQQALAAAGYGTSDFELLNEYITDVVSTRFETDASGKEKFVVPQSVYDMMKAEEEAASEENVDANIDDEEDLTFDDDKAEKVTKEESMNEDSKNEDSMNEKTKDEL